MLQPSVPNAPRVNAESWARVTGVTLTPGGFTRLLSDELSQRHFTGSKSHASNDHVASSEKLKSPPAAQYFGKRSLRRTLSILDNLADVVNNTQVQVVHFAVEHHTPANDPG
ncbi:hypothetical protein ON010_g13666 [Phytophthora cinnamomi]|nr:hypothetical protein ON010_g13666 [Phytophthora cinnamomi]